MEKFYALENQVSHVPVLSHGTKVCDFPRVPQIIGVFAGQKLPDPQTLLSYLEGLTVCLCGLAAIKSC